MAYMQKQTKNTSGTTHFTLVPWLDISPYPAVKVLDLVFDHKQWQVINFYHDISNTSLLNMLLGLDINTTIPALVIGDFNVHSQTWSPPGIPCSKGATRIEQWAATNLLTLANTAREITRKGASHKRDSVINLAWFNGAMVRAFTFSDLIVD